MESFSPYIVWILFFVLAIPLAFNLVQANALVGFRFASARANSEVWRRVNILFGRLLMIASLFGVALTLFLPSLTIASGIFLPIGTLLVVVVIAFSYMKAISSNAQNR